MYSIRVEQHFSSAHNLRGYRGKCEALHGHNWKVEAVVAASQLDKTGMVADFHVVKGKLKRIVAALDHTYLNRTPYFRRVNPTSENLARYIYERLNAVVKGLRSVTVWENATSAATYEP